MRRDLDPTSTLFSWRQIRHGKNHRRPTPHCDRCARDEETMPDEDRERLWQIENDYDERIGELLKRREQP